MTPSWPPWVHARSTPDHLPISESETGERRPARPPERVRFRTPNSSDPGKNGRGCRERSISDDLAAQPGPAATWARAGRRATYRSTTNASTSTRGCPDVPYTTIFTFWVPGVANGTWYTSWRYFVVDENVRGRSFYVPAELSAAPPVVEAAKKPRRARSPRATR